MKKKLEADLISIAHRILKLKNISELDQLYLETQKLYEKLAVLKFVETHFADVKPTIGHAEISEKLAVILEDETEKHHESMIAREEYFESGENRKEKTDAPEIVAAQEVAEPEVTEKPSAESDQMQEPQADAVTPEEEIKTEPAKDPKSDVFNPSFELSFDRKENEVEEKSPKQISFDDLMVHHYEEPVFERADKVKKEDASKEAIQLESEPVTAEEDAAKEEDVPEADAVAEETTPEETTPEETTPEEKQQDDKNEPSAEKPENKSTSLNDALSKNISIGLNDRIGFEKQLFGGSSEDLNRVLSQLNTFTNLQEAQDFIEDMVKPDYNNWEGKDDYAQRFMEIVEKKFS